MLGSHNVADLIHQLDGDLVVVAKPPGLPTTGLTLDDQNCVQAHLIQHFGTMVWALHQLDADTSGVCLFTRSKALVKKVKARWSTPETQKIYLAVVEGQPEWETMEADFPIGELSPNNLGVCADGKEARTSFCVIGRAQGHALVRATLHTGRTHQIRIHLSHLGHAVVGEKWYRTEPSTEHPRHALHAYQLSIPPVVGIKGTRWTIPLAEDLERLVHSLGLKVNLSYRV